MRSPTNMRRRAQRSKENKRTTCGARRGKIWHPSCSPLRHVAGQARGTGGRDENETSIVRGLRAGSGHRRSAGATLSVAPGHHDRAVRRGRADRRACAHRGGAHAQRPGAIGAGRERDRRFGHDRRRARRACRGGRLHDGARQLAVVRGGERHLCEPALRRHQGLRADRAASQQSLHRRQQEGPAGEGSEGADRLHQGEPGQAFRRHRRRRIGPACQRRLFPEGDRTRASPSCRIAPARPT